MLKNLLACLGAGFLLVQGARAYHTYMKRRTRMEIVDEWLAKQPPKPAV